jgi:hypothetical protein
MSRLQFRHAELHTGVVDSRRFEGQVGKWWTTESEDSRRQFSFSKKLDLKTDLNSNGDGLCQFLVTVKESEILIQFYGKKVLFGGGGGEGGCGVR